MLIKKMMLIIAPSILLLIYYNYKKLRIDRHNLIHGTIVCIKLHMSIPEDEDYKHKFDGNTPIYICDYRIQFGDNHYTIEFYLNDNITISEKNEILDQLDKLSNQYWKSFAGTTLIIGKATFILTKHA